MEVEVVVDVVLEVVARVMEAATRWGKPGMRLLKFFRMDEGKGIRGGGIGGGGG